MTIGIYVIINSINGKKYIGSTNQFERRFKQHLWLLRKNKHSNQKMQHAYNKYGEQFFRYELIEEVSENELLKKEEFWINKLDSIKKGYNINEKADRPPSWKGKKHDEKTRKKMSEYQRNKPPVTQDTKEKIKESWKVRKLTPVSDLTRQRLSDSTKGENNPMHGRTPYNIWILKYGKEEADKKRKSRIEKYTASMAKYKGSNSPSCRPEVRKKLSDAKMGQKHSIEARQKMSATRKGVKPSKETRQKWSLNRRGEKNSAAKISDVIRDEIYQKLLNGEKAKNLAIEYGLCYASIGKIRRWEYSTPKPKNFKEPYVRNNRKIY